MPEETSEKSREAFKEAEARIQEALKTDATGLDLSRLGLAEVPESLGTWQQFLAVRSGKMANPCPPEVGLRMAKLWDAIQKSAAQGGALVQL